MIQLTRWPPPTTAQTRRSTIPLSTSPPRSTPAGSAGRRGPRRRGAQGNRRAAGLRRCGRGPSGQLNHERTPSAESNGALKPVLCPDWLAELVNRKHRNDGLRCGDLHYFTPSSTLLPRLSPCASRAHSGRPGDYWRKFHYFARTKRKV